MVRVTSTVKTEVGHFRWFSLSRKRERCLIICVQLLPWGYVIIGDFYMFVYCPGSWGKLTKEQHTQKTIMWEFIRFSTGLCKDGNVLSKARLLYSYWPDYHLIYHVKQWYLEYNYQWFWSFCQATISRLPWNLIWIFIVPKGWTAMFVMSHLTLCGQRKFIKCVTYLWMWSTELAWRIWTHHEPKVNYIVHLLWCHMTLSGGVNTGYMVHDRGNGKFCPALVRSPCIQAGMKSAQYKMFVVTCKFQWNN